MAFLDGDDEFITKIIAIGNQSIVLLVIALKELKKGDHLVEHYTYWKEQSIQNQSIIVNVGRNKLNETHLATSRLAGNHWECFLVEFSSTDIFYCDSLAWSLPIFF